MGIVPPKKGCAALKIVLERPQLLFGINARFDERSLIRPAAYEVTYNIHFMIRFDLEPALLEGELSVCGLSEVWIEHHRKDLGLEIVFSHFDDGKIQENGGQGCSAVIENKP